MNIKLNIEGIKVCTKEAAPKKNEKKGSKQGERTNAVGKGVITDPTDHYSRGMLINNTLTKFGLLRHDFIYF